MSQFIPSRLRAALSVAALLTFSAAAPAAENGTAAERLLRQLDSVRTVSCEIRREIDQPGGRLRMLSRVFYERPDRLHVENHTPVRRRIVSDGENFHSLMEGARRGFRRPVAELSEEMRVELRKVPGSAGVHLHRLRGLPETALPPTDEFPRRYGYAGERLFTVLGLDAEGRLAGVEFHDARDRERRLGRYRYSRFVEVAPGVQIPMRHDGVMTVEDREIRETVRIERYVVNEPVPAGLFQPAAFFEGVAFSTEFEE